jgi:hypothetical protein
MGGVDVKLISFLFYFLLCPLPLPFSVLVSGLRGCEAAVGVSINKFFRFTGVEF